MGDNMYYLTRKANGILIKDASKEYLISTGIKKYINKLCMSNLSTYDGRRLSTAKLLNQKDNIPIYIDRSTFLFPTKALREYDTMFINYFSILSIRKIDHKNTLFIFDNLEEITINISIKKVYKQYKRIEKINDYLQYNT